MRILAPLERELHDCTPIEKRQEWEMLRSKDCNDSFTAETCRNLFSSACCANHQEHDKSEPRLLEEEIRGTEILHLCSKFYCCYDFLSSKLDFSSEGPIKGTIGASGDKAMAKDRKLSDKTGSVTSTNHGCRIKNHCLAT